MVMEIWPLISKGVDSMLLMAINVFPRICTLQNWGLPPPFTSNLTLSKTVLCRIFIEGSSVSKDIYMVGRTGKIWECDLSWTQHDSHIVFQKCVTYFYFLWPLIRRLGAAFGCGYSAMYFGYQAMQKVMSGKSWEATTVSPQHHH